MSDITAFFLVMGIMVFFTAVHMWAVVKHPEWFQDYNHWGDL